MSRGGKLRGRSLGCKSKEKAEWLHFPTAPCTNSEPAGSCGTPDPISCVYDRMSFPRKEKNRRKLCPCESCQIHKFTNPVPRLFGAWMGQDDRKAELCRTAKQRTAQEERVRSKGRARCLFGRGGAAEGWEAAGAACEEHRGLAAPPGRIRKKSRPGHKDIGAIDTAPAAARNGSCWTQTFGSR